jgi:hypothetical protein
MPDQKTDFLNQEIAPTEDDQGSILRELELDRPVVNNIEEKQTMKTQQPKRIMLVLCVVAIAAGIGTGFGAFKLQAKNPASTGPQGSNLQQVAGSTIKEGDVFGIKDDKTFKDSAEGYLEAASSDEEGSHRLLREGGESQTVHLTSSSTDLDKFIGMEVKVKGETFKGQQAGWLMDVGQVEVVKVQGEKPSEY